MLSSLAKRPEYHPERATRQAVSPLAWACDHATLVHPARGRLAFDPYPYQRRFLEAYDQPRRLILKARQIGFSQVFAVEALYAAANEPDSTILMVSRSQDMAVNLLRYCYIAYNGLRQPPPLDKENESEMGLNGSRIKSIPANRSTGRGFAARRVYLDEFAFADYADDIYTSVSPTVSQGGTITIGSTPNGTGNLFYRLWMADNDFYKMKVPWYRCPSYNPDGHDHPDETEARGAGEAGDWYAIERRKYTHQQWASEFECDFVGSGDAIFTADDLDRAEVGAIGSQERQERHRYVIAVDIGRRQDATVINVFDITDRPFQRVYHERLTRMPYPLLQAAIEQAARRYGDTLCIESNGVGDPVIENLSVRAEPFVTSQRSKVQAIQALQLLLQNGDLKAAWTPVEREELLLYQWDDRDLQQDCVMSLAIAASVASQQPVRQMPAASGSFRSYR